MLHAVRSPAKTTSAIHPIIENAIGALMKEEKNGYETSIINPPKMNRFLTESP